MQNRKFVFTYAMIPANPNSLSAKTDTLCYFSTYIINKPILKSNRHTAESDKETDS